MHGKFVSSRFLREKQQRLAIDFDKQKQNIFANFRRKLFAVVTRIESNAQIEFQCT